MTRYRAWHGGREPGSSGPEEGPALVTFGCELCLTCHIFKIEQSNVDQLAVRKRNEVMCVNTCHIVGPQRRLTLLSLLLSSSVCFMVNSFNFMRRQNIPGDQESAFRRHLPSGSKTLRPRNVS